jgi:hypothetical protein
MAERPNPPGGWPVHSENPPGIADNKRRSRAAKNDEAVIPRVSRHSQLPQPDHVVPPEELSGMIAEAAYYRAERRGLHEGYEIEDWLAAEAEIMARMREVEQASRVGPPAG